MLTKPNTTLLQIFRVNIGIKIFNNLPNHEQFNTIFEVIKIYMQLFH